MDLLLQYFIEYRYLVIFLGTFIEGEVILIAGGFLVYEGHLSFPVLVAVATVAATVGDNLFYWLGRSQRTGVKHSWTSRFLTYIGKHRLFKGEEFIQRHGGKSVFFIRFFYGLRFAGAITAGYLGMRFRRFFFFNLVGSFTWALVIGSTGYVFGQSLELVARGVKLAEVGLLLVIAGILTIYLLNSRRKKKNSKGPP
ncbi:MAG: DedA family protein [Candidatus Binatia bacterium]